MAQPSASNTATFAEVGAVIDALAARSIIGGYALDDNQILITATEMTRGEDIRSLCTALEDIL